jgi:hypothetical protein
MVAASPDAVVIVAPAENELVPEGANQIASAESPVPVMVTVAPPFTEIEVANAVFWEVGGTVSTVQVEEEVAAPSACQLPAASAPIT